MNTLTKLGKFDVLGQTTWAKELKGIFRNSILGMQCKTQTADMHLHGEDLQRRNAPQNWIYGIALST